MLLPKIDVIQGVLKNNQCRNPKGCKYRQGICAATFQLYVVDVKQQFGEKSILICINFINIVSLRADVLRILEKKWYVYSTLTLSDNSYIFLVQGLGSYVFSPRGLMVCIVIKLHAKNLRILSIFERYFNRIQLKGMNEKKTNIATDINAILFVQFLDEPLTQIIYLQHFMPLGLYPPLKILILDN